MEKIKKNVLTALFVLAIALPSIAAVSSDSVATDMIKKAEALYHKIGAAAAKVEFSKPNGDYVKGDIYIYCAGNADHKVNTHPTNKALIGVDMFTLKDVDKVEFGKIIMTTAEPGKIKTIDYKWTNPTTKTMGVKRAYFENFGSDTCVVGFFK